VGPEATEHPRGGVVCGLFRTAHKKQVGPLRLGAEGEFGGYLETRGTALFDDAEKSNMPGGTLLAHGRRSLARDRASDSIRPPSMGKL
jgi:hypothetical protein